MRNTILPLLSILFLAAGCGGTDMLGDDGGTTPGPDLAGAHLQSGTYNVSNVVAVKDDCQTMFDATNTPTLQVVNTGTMLSIGTHWDANSTPAWNPPGYGLGTGAYTDSTHATLTVSATSTDSSTNCTYDLSRTTLVTFTGMNMLSVDYTDNESNFSAGCGVSFTSCTSHYTFDLAM